MSRVNALLQKLLSQHEAAVPHAEMLLTVKMLQKELQQNEIQHSGANCISLSSNMVDVPDNPAPGAQEKKPPTYDELEKEFSVLHVDEVAIDEELQAIHANRENLGKLELNGRAKNLHLLAVEDDTAPTLAQQNTNPHGTIDLNDKLHVHTKSVSLNDLFTGDAKETHSPSAHGPIEDLKKAISLNESYVFINDLFRGDDVMYNRSIKTINSCKIYAEAEFWIQRELKVKLGWDDNNPIVKDFYQLVRRRFNVM